MYTHNICFNVFFPSSKLDDCRFRIFVVCFCFISDAIWFRMEQRIRTDQKKKKKTRRRTAADNEHDIDICFEHKHDINICLIFQYFQSYYLAKNDAIKVQKGKPKEKQTKGWLTRSDSQLTCSYLVSPLSFEFIERMHLDHSRAIENIFGRRQKYLNQSFVNFRCRVLSESVHTASLSSRDRIYSWPSIGVSS